MICRVFGHRVDRKRVRIRDYDTYVGRCRRCSVRMIKTEAGWQVEADPE